MKQPAPLLPYLISQAQNNYVFACDNIVPIIPRDTLCFETILTEAQNPRHPHGVQTMFELLLLRNFPDKIPLSLARNISLHGETEVRDIAYKIVKSRSEDYVIIHDMISEAQYQMNQPAELQLVA